MRMTLVTALAMVLSATSLHPLFATSAWVGPVMGGIALAAVVGLIARSTPWPRVATVVFAPIVGLVYLTALYAKDQASGGVLPTSSSLHQLRLLLTAANSDAKTLAAPVQPTPALLMMTVGGLFLAAVAADFIAVTSRRAVLAGVPILSIFAVPAGILAGEKGGVGVLGFGLTAAGWLMLLAFDSETHLGSWGQMLKRPPSATSRIDPGAGSPLGVTGRRIGSIALGVAIIVPLALPSLPNHGLGGSDGSNAGPRSQVVIPPLVTLEKRLHSDVVTPLLKVKTDTPGYLRMTALDSFDGLRFTLDPLSAPQSAKISKGIPKPPGPDSVPVTQVEATISGTSSFAESYLPVPYAPAKVDAAGDWRTETSTFTIFSSRANTRSLTYEVTSNVPAPDADTLRAASKITLPDSVDLARDLALPEIPAPVVDLESQIAGRATTPYDAAVAIQDYLRSSIFTYDLSAQPLSGGNPLTDFLLVSRRGYCEQFASAMVVLARLRHIPARVAVGFTPGTKQSDGSYLITNRDAHSWPELYFAGAGWVRFEPTPLTQGRGNVPSYTAPQSTTPSSPTPGSPNPTPTAGATDPIQQRLQRDLERESDANPPTLATAFPQDPDHTWLWLTALVLLAIVFTVPGSVRVAQRRRRLHGDVTTAWDELLTTADDLGVPVLRSMTPRQIGDELSRQGAEVVALRTLVAGIERARYAGRSDPSNRAAELDAARSALRSLLSTVTRARRWWTALMPVSVLRDGQRAVDATGRRWRKWVRTVLARRSTEA